MLMSGFFMGYLIMQLPIGYVSDRIGVKRVYTVSLILIGILSILTGFTMSFIDCFVYRFANGLAAGCLFAPGSALVLRWFPPKDRAIAISLYTVSTSVGTAIALGSSASISAAFGGWRWAFWLFGIPALIVAMLSIFLLKEKPREGIHGNMVGERKSLGVYYGIVLKDWRVWFLCFATLGGCSVYIGSLTWIPTYLVRFVGLTKVHAGSISSLMVLPSIIATPLSGFVADRIINKRIPIIFFGVFASGLACMLVSLLMPKELYTSIALFVPLLFFSSMWWISPSLLSEWVPLDVMGTASGFNNFMTIIGAVIGPFIFGIILDLMDSFSLGWFALGCIATVLVLPMLSIMAK